MTLDFTQVFSYWHVLLQGLGITLAFTLSCAVIGSVVGFIISLLRLSPVAPVRWIMTLYVEFFRGTPLLIQLVWVFFCFPVVSPP